jgi:hypothetical protein
MDKEQISNETKIEDGKEKKKRSQPRWMEPLNFPELMPKKIREDAYLTEEIKREVWKKQLYSATILRSGQLLQATAAKQKRRDENHRKILVGAITMKLMAKDAALKTKIHDAILREVKVGERFLFPEQFPDAVRPSKIEPGTFGIDPDPAEPEDASDEEVRS